MNSRPLTVIVHKTVVHSLEKFEEPNPDASFKVKYFEERANSVRIFVKHIAEQSYIKQDTAVSANRLHMGRVRFCL